MQQRDLPCGNHLARLGSQDRAAEDTLRRFFDYGVQKTVHLASGLCARYCQRSDRNLENAELQSAGLSFLLRQADMHRFIHKDDREEQPRIHKVILPAAGGLSGLILSEANGYPIAYDRIESGRKS